MLLKIKPAELLKDRDVKFGTSGVRGLVSDFKDDIAATYTIAFITHLKNQGFKFKRVAIGCDLRSSSPRLVNAVIHGIKQCELIPIFAGPIMTPALVYYGLQHKMPTIMITGSHIPDSRNGLKFTTPVGEITKEDEKSINSTLVHLEISAFNKKGFLKIKEHVKKDTKVLGMYRDRYLKILPEGLLTGLRIGLYEHSSVGRDFYKDLYQALGAEVIPFGRTHGFIPVDTEAVRPEDVAMVRGWCATQKVHCVISADGDADRPLVFDESGNVIRGDILGTLVSKILKADTVVTPISSNTVIERSGWFPKVIRTKIGSPYVLEAMSQAEGNVIGFEANGGIIHQNELKLLGGELRPLPTRDSTLAHLCVFMGLLANKIEASKLKSCLPSRHVYSGLLKDVDIPKTRAVLKRLAAIEVGAEFLSGIVITDKNLLDGVRVTTENEDIIHLRLSGNAPELRCYCESSDDFSAEILLERALLLMRDQDIFS